MAESSISLESISIYTTLNKKVDNHSIRYFRSLLWRQSRIYPRQPMEQISTTPPLYSTYFIIWQPWYLLPFLFLLTIIWFFVSAVRQPLKPLTRTVCLALLPNTEDAVWRWDPPILGLAAGRVWNGLSGLIWTGLEGSTVLAICIPRWYCVLDANKKKERKKEEDTSPEVWRMQTNVMK